MCQKPMKNHISQKARVDINVDVNNSLHLVLFLDNLILSLIMQNQYTFPLEKEKGENMKFGKRI